MGVIEFTQQDDIWAGYVERPRGVRICTGVFRPEAPLDPPPDGTPLRVCSLRVIPSPEKDKDHSLVELIQTDMILSSVEVWAGTGSCHFPGISVFDPWHKLPVKNLLAASHIVADFVLPEGRILETL
jgi:acetoacetate decarboxylase